MFKESINKNLPELLKRRPNLYALIESLQPHKCGDDWLIELCDQTNFNKHNKLSSQVRKNSEQSTINIGRYFRIEGGSTITFDDCSFDGIPVGREKPVVIDSDMSAKQIQSVFGSSIPVNKEFEWVEFRFENSAIDTLALIEKAHTEISKYISLLNTGLS